MTKEVKTSPPDKWTKAPAIIKDENTLFHDLCDGTVSKYNRVTIVSTPFITSEAYRANYNMIFKHD